MIYAAAGYLLLVIVFVYALGKVILYVMLLSGQIKFSWQNQFDEHFGGHFSGYMKAMAVISLWPVTATYIKQAKTM